MHVQRPGRGGFARALLFGVLAALMAGTAHAQWTQTSGPKGGFARSFLALPNGSGVTLYTGGVRVWRTDDRGASWTSLGNGLTDVNAFALLALPSGSGGNDLFVGTGHGVFRSADNGASWSPSTNGIPASSSIYALASGPNGSGGTNLYAGLGSFVGQVYRSTDNGTNWTSVSSGLAVGQGNINALTTTASGTVLAGTGNGIYRSTNFGASWTRVLDRYGFSFAKNGSTLYAGTSSGVWRSTNDGATWTAINNGMNFTWVYAVAAIPSGSGVTLFASAGGVMRSVDDGATWTPVNNGLTTIGIYAFATAPNASGGTDLFAGGGEGVFRTSNNGGTWTDVSFISTYLQALEVTPGGAVLAGGDHLYRTTDAGGNWAVTMRVGSPILDFAVNPQGASGVSVFAGGASFGLFKSIDDGVTWAGIAVDDIEVNSVGVVPNGSGGTNVVVGAYSGMFVSTNDGGSWLHVQPNFMGLDYVVVPNGSGGHTVFGGGFNGVWRSTNGGMTWAHVALGEIVQGMAATGNGATLFAGGDPFGVYRSTDNGATWTLANNGLTDLRITTLLSPDGTNLFAAGAGGVFLSTDNGNSWTSVGAGLAGGVSSLAVSKDGSTLFAANSGFGVWKRPLSEMIGGAPPPPPPPPAPAIVSFAPASGGVGTEVTITGSNFTGASAVTFNLVASSFTVVSGGEVRATVPSGASTGRIRVTTPGGTATSATDFSVSTPPPPTTLTFTPPHDAYVRSNSTNSNFGSRPELSVRGGSTRIVSYLKFTVSGLTGTVQSAKLRLRVTDGGPRGGAVFSVSNNLRTTSTPWTESAITWNNAPSITGSALAVIGVVSAGTWVELDITSTITGNGTYSFAVDGSSSNVVDYSSSEGANPPQLVVVTGLGVRAAEPQPLASMTIARELALVGNHPNPFRAGTTIQYSLPQRTSVRLVIYDITGRAVRTLVDGVEDAGDRRVAWDGRDEQGMVLRSGMYVYRLEADGRSLTRKMNLLK